MIGRSHRFHGRNALNRVYKTGKTVRSPLMNLRFVSRGADKPYRVAVVVSRKVSKSAVTRNRIRRRIYAAVRGGSAGIKPGTDLVFTAFSDSLAKVPASELNEAVAKLLQRAA